MIENAHPPYEVVASSPLSGFEVVAVQTRAGVRYAAHSLTHPEAPLFPRREFRSIAMLDGFAHIKPPSLSQLTALAHQPISPSVLP